MKTQSQETRIDQSSFLKKASKIVEPGRLLGVTATGPVYLGKLEFTVVPIASMFALLQELALRVDQPHAKVVSSLANRVSGKEAYLTWVELSAEFSTQLLNLSARARRAFLYLTLNLIRQAGRVDGLEPILASAVNAVWPLISASAMDKVLNLANAQLNKSEFSRRHSVPVVDVYQRTAGVLKAGYLHQLDLAEWRASRALLGDALNSGLGSDIDSTLANAVKSPLERAIDEIFGDGSRDDSFSDTISSLTTGNDASGVPGGLPGVGDIPGRREHTKGKGQSLDEVAQGLLEGNNAAGVPGGLRNVADLPGSKQSHGDGFTSHSKSRSVQSILDEQDGLTGFLRQHGTGGFQSGAFSGATPGGPFAPTGKLPGNGSGGETPDENVATGAAIVGAAVVTVALAPEVTVAAATVAAVGTIIVVGAGLYLAGKGLGDMLNDYAHELPGRSHRRPGSNDLYPDPVGGGDGNPTQVNADSEEGSTSLPDFDGAGGGTPNTIWGKGKEGVSIWDDNFGGPGPTVRPPTFAAQSLAGPGLMANIVQIAPATIRF